MAPDTIFAPTAPQPDGDAPWRIAGLPAPLPGDPKRQAIYSIQGTVYQAWWSIDAWLRLASPDEAIYLEGAEDFDIVQSDIAITVQVKKHATSISLGAGKAHEALETPGLRPQTPRMYAPCPECEWP
ncbi:hypothetical protein YTPLAS72_32680 [Nitrospira sp.]|nr:hypothetical protein YTPLAS72_32680 [Nitrospira sp.]